MNHLDLLAMFNQSLRRIEYNRYRIAEILQSAPDKESIDVCIASIEKLDEIELDLHTKMAAIGSLN